MFRFEASSPIWRKKWNWNEVTVLLHMPPMRYVGSGTPPSWQVKYHLAPQVNPQLKGLFTRKTKQNLPVSKHFH